MELLAAVVPRSDYGIHISPEETYLTGPWGRTDKYFYVEIWPALFHIRVVVGALPASDVFLWQG